MLLSIRTLGGVVLRYARMMVVLMTLGFSMVLPAVGSAGADEIDTVEGVVNPQVSGARRTAQTEVKAGCDLILGLPPSPEPRATACETASGSGAPGGFYFALAANKLGSVTRIVNMTGWKRGSLRMVWNVDRNGVRVENGDVPCSNAEYCDYSNRQFACVLGEVIYYDGAGYGQGPGGTVPGEAAAFCPC